MAMDFFKPQKKGFNLITGLYTSRHAGISTRL